MAHRLYKATEPLRRNSWCRYFADVKPWSLPGLPGNWMYACRRRFLPNASNKSYVDLYVTTKVSKYSNDCCNGSKRSTYLQSRHGLFFARKHLTFVRNWWWGKDLHLPCIFCREPADYERYLAQFQIACAVKHSKMGNQFISFRSLMHIVQ